MHRLKTWSPLFLVWLVVLIFFYPVWGQGKNAIPADTLTGLYHPFRDYVAPEYPNGTPYKNYLITDAVRQQYLYRQFSIEQLKQGEIPWWNPYNFSGTPHLAGVQAASFYPLNLVFWIWDFTAAWNLLVMSQMFLGSLFMFVFLRHLGLRCLAAGFGSVVWVFSGFFVVWQMWNTAAHVALWSPLILLTIDKLIGKNSPKLSWLLILVFSLTAQFYAGYPQPWLYLSLLQVSYAISRLLSDLGDLSSFWKKMLRLAIPYACFALLAAPQMLATLEFSDLSNRVLDQGDLLAKPDWFVPFPQLLQMIIPDYFGNPATLNYWGVFNYTEFVAYIGVTGLVFVLMSLMHVRRKLVWFFGFWIALALLLALRNPISVLQFQFSIPFISGSQPSRWIVVINMAAAILSAIGFDYFLRKKSLMLRPMILVGLILASAWTWVINPVDTDWFAISQNTQTTIRNLILPTVEYLTLIVLFGGVWLSQSRLAKLKQFNLHRWSLVLVFCLTTLVGYRFADKYTPFTNPEWLYPQTSTTQFLQENLGEHRYMTLDARLMPPNVNMAYEIQTIEGYDPLYLEMYGRLITFAQSDLGTFPETSNAFNRILRQDNFHSQAYSALGVKYLLTMSPLEDEQFELVHEEGETLVYENLSVYPRAFLIDSFDPFPAEEYVPAEIVSYSAKEVVIKAEAETESILVLSDSWYPHWQVYLNGEPSSVLNYIGLRATIIPEGTHEIVYKYRHSYF